MALMLCNKRIYRDREGGIEKSVLRITVWQMYLSGVQDSRRVNHRRDT